MSRTRIIKPSVSIGGTEFKCASRSVTLEPGDPETYCDYEWTCSIDLELTYGTGGTYNIISAWVDTTGTFVLSPSDGAIGSANPSATFEATIPPIPFMMGAEKGERQVFTLELMLDEEPTIAYS